MSKCSNCYSNCAEIISDKCVKYTGLEIPALEIENGDSVNYVISKMAQFFSQVLDGSAIQYEISPENLCEILSSKFEDCEVITQVKISNVFAATICELDARLTALEEAQTELNSDYIPRCIVGINGTEGTKPILQATIDYLCDLSTRFDALKLNVETNYVLISDLDTYIANYLAELGDDEDPLLQLKPKDKMVPYSVVEYYGPLNVFDPTGAGIGEWEQIYLCNGNNGTPDKRGRIGVGTTEMGNGLYPPATDPSISGNPTYVLLGTTGSNFVTLTTSEIPSHTHPGTTLSAGDHTHFLTSDGNAGQSLTDPDLTLDQNWSGNTSRSYTLKGNNLEANSAVTSNEGNHNHVLQIGSTGGNESHSNIPPVLACHYIMYIPQV